MNLTFDVYQNRVYLRRESGVGHATEKKGSFPATMAGLRKAYACVAEHTYGQEPGRIAPKASCVIVAAVDGEPLKLAGHEPYEDRDSWLNYWTIDKDEVDPSAHLSRMGAIGARVTKTNLFKVLMARIDAAAREQAIKKHFKGDPRNPEPQR